MSMIADHHQITSRRVWWTYQALTYQHVEKLSSYGIVGGGFLGLTYLLFTQRCWNQLQIRCLELQGQYLTREISTRTTYVSQSSN
jgi:hypothetical protein